MHLRQAVADAFDLEFESIGLVEGVYGKEGREGFVAASFEVTGTEPLPPEKDFHSLQLAGWLSVYGGVEGRCCLLGSVVGCRVGNKCQLSSSFSALLMTYAAFSGIFML